jgi:hypothetical protein
MQSTRGEGPNSLLSFPHLLNYSHHRLLDSDDEDDEDDLMYLDAAPAAGSSTRRQAGPSTTRQPARRTTSASRRPASSSSRRTTSSSRNRNGGAGIERFLQTFPTGNGGDSGTAANSRTREGTSTRQRNDAGTGYTLGEAPGGAPAARRPPRDRDPRTGV